jgi:mono/diheme cytochrome c family protein
MSKFLIIPLVLLAVVIMAYEAFIYYDNNFRFGRMWETAAVSSHEQELPKMDPNAIPFKGGEAFFRAADGKDLKSPLQEGDHANMEMGKVLYFTYCAACHGKYHDGNGTVGQSFHPLPADLRSEKIQLLADGLIFKEISYGKRNGRQPPLATTIDIMDRWRIIAYIKSLGMRITF